MRNPKEARSSNEEKDAPAAAAFSVRISSFGFISNFGFRFSNFLLLSFEDRCSLPHRLREDLCGFAVVKVDRLDAVRPGADAPLGQAEGHQLLLALFAEEEVDQPLGQLGMAGAFDEGDGG